MIARRSLLIVTTQLFTRFIGWIALIILAKVWGNFAPEALGTIGFAMAFVSVFTFISDLGFSQAHVKRVSEGNEIGVCLGTFMTVKLVLTLLMVTVIGLLLLVSNMINISFYDSTNETIVLIFVYYYILVNISQIALTTFQATKEIVKRQLVTLTENFIKVPLFITIVFLASNIIYYDKLPEGPVTFLSMTYVAGIFATVCIGFYFLRKYPIKKPTKEMFKSYVKFAFPVMLLSIISAVSINVDKLMIGYFWTSVEVGYYFTVQQILQIILIFSSSIGIVLFPTMSEYHSKNNIQKIKDKTLLAMRYISMIMIPIVIFIIVFVEPIINIMLTDVFLPASNVLIVLSLLAFVTAIGIALNSLIVGMDKPGHTAKIGIVMCVSNLILNVLFIPSNGLLTNFGINGPTGAAVATLISGIFGFIGLCYYSKKLTGIKIIRKYHLYHLIAGLIMGFYFYLVKLNFVDIPFYVLVIVCIVGFAMYAGILLAFKELKPEDIQFFKDLIHPKEMLKYIGGELKK